VDRNEQLGDREPLVGRVKPAGSTPTTVSGVSSTTIDRPTMPGSALNRWRHVASVRTATLGRSLGSSSGVRVLPIAARTRRTSNNDPLLRPTSTCVASPTPVRFAGRTMYCAIDSKLFVRLRQYSKCCSLTSSTGIRSASWRQVSRIATSCCDSA